MGELEDGMLWFGRESMGEAAGWQFRDAEKGPPAGAGRRIGNAASHGSPAIPVPLPAVKGSSGAQEKYGFAAAASGAV